MPRKKPKIVANVRVVNIDNYRTYVVFDMPAQDIFEEILDGVFSKSKPNVIFLRGAYEEEDIKNMLKYSKKKPNVEIFLDKTFRIVYSIKFRRRFPNPRCSFTNGHWSSPKTQYPQVLLYQHDGVFKKICG